MRPTPSAVICLMLPCLLLAQEALTNDSVLKLTKSGLSEDLIVSMIRTQPSKFSVGADDVVALKKAGVPDKVLEAMVNKSAGAATPASPPAAAAPSTTFSDLGAPAGSSLQPPPQVNEPGVFYKKAGEWMELLPEVVNWKTGGTVKTIATVGVIKRDINGIISGLHSRNSVPLPLEFMINTPEGVAITEYQLLRLRANKDYREFRTVTGGVFNQRSGSMRDMVPFESKKIANHVYGVILPATLGAGDYGFIFLGASGGAGGTSSLSMGKMYTFRIVE